MGISDWLFEKRKAREDAREGQAFLESKLAELNARPEPTGAKSAAGLPICPHCSHEFSVIETGEYQTDPALPVFNCPRCRRSFKL
jgi:hypothetical protein